MRATPPRAMLPYGTRRGSYGSVASDRAAYWVADAADLPFGDAEFDLVVAYNSLMDFDDLEASVSAGPA